MPVELIINFKHPFCFYRLVKTERYRTLHQHEPFKLHHLQLKSSEPQVNITSRHTANTPVFQEKK